MIDSPPRTLAAWIQDARRKLADGAFAPADLDALAALLGRGSRQRLLYLHTREPSVTSAVIAMVEHDPAAAPRELSPFQDEWPYDSVLAAMRDGWQVIHFPNQLSPFDDCDTDLAGYEFVLQKLEHAR